MTIPTEPVTSLIEWCFIVTIAQQSPPGTQRTIDGIAAGATRFAAWQAIEKLLQEKSGSPFIVQFLSLEPNCPQDWTK